MAQAIHSGAVRLPAHTVSGASINPNLTCTPAPCALPNVQASGGNGSNISNENPIAVNPAKKSNLLTGGNDYNCTSSLQGFYASTNGGKTWTATCMDTLSGAFGDGDPGVAFTTTGTAYRTGIDGGTADGYDIVYGKSTDGGKTWSPSAIAVRPLFSGGLTDKDWLWIDNSKTSKHVNNLYVSVTQFDSSQSNTEISVSHSSDGGSTWTTVPVDTEQFSPNIDQFSDVTTGKDGTVYVTWMRCTANGPSGDCGGTTATMMFSKSTDGGNTWSTAVAVGKANLAPDNCGAYYGCLPNTFERVSNIPAVGVDNSKGPNAGHLYVVDYNYNGTNLRVQVTTSTNGGTSWGKAVAVAPKSAKNDEFFPWLSVNPKGFVGVTWLDRRNDSSNVSYEAFAAAAHGGTGFAKHNVQIASVASNPNNDGFGGGFMGDYTGNAWAGNTLYASWMDTRNGSNCQDEVGGYLK